MLFDLDEEMRREAGPVSVLWKNPKLKNQKNLLKRLSDGLTAAETAKTSGGKRVPHPQSILKANQSVGASSQP